MSEENVMAENEQKKNYLYQYRTHVRRIKRIEAELDEIRAMKMHPSVVNDGMPHGCGQNDMPPALTVWNGNYIMNAILELRPTWIYPEGLRG